ncbi:hypothetical protein FH972_000427 [Carpinus fangiana]|uniref:F-box domain-containing protein n=1 Tax=Carpinus fangiana TaxID=176857 RepID=A0A5N6QBT2_9ROSI|nr:hypothetical protein FH972_000427 [Carpinus fangiana]
MFKDLPEDLVAQILVWLPVVSLLRCKCVSKSWYALITHQSFVRKHLLHNKNSSNTLLLLNMFNITTLNFVFSTLSYETFQLSLTQPAHPWGFGNIKKGNIRVVGSCNGLVCLHAMSSFVVIWNPATRETKVVPESNLPRHLPAGYKIIIDNIQFGFDAKTNDYKIINLLTPFDVDVAAKSFRRGGIIQSEVYSLSADSWRKGDNPLCCTGELNIGGLNTYINGMASWSASVGWEGMVLYDSSTKEMTNLPIDGETFLMELVTYMETLVSVNGRK